MAIDTSRLWRWLNPDRHPKGVLSSPKRPSTTTNATQVCRGREAAPHLADERGRQYISDMLIALSRATPEQAFLLRAYVGNYSLFISGIFHENTQRRSLRGAPDMKFYELIGRTNYQLLARHPFAPGAGSPRLSCARLNG